MTVKQHRMQAAPNGRSDPDKRKLEPLLPSDHPSGESRYPRKTPTRLAQRVLRVIESSGLLPELEKRLRCHPGRQSRLSIKTLLMCMILAAEETERYLRSDICSVINGLDHRLGVALGLWTLDERPPVTYTTVVKQLNRLEIALWETWFASNGDVRSLGWFMQTFLSSTLPWELKPEITTVALDWTPIQTWAVTKDYRIEEEARKVQSPEEDGGIGTLDLRSRLRRSACPDARGGWRTATSKTPAGPFTGFYGHALTLAADATWSGNPNKIRIGNAPPMFSPFVKSVPANNDIALTGLHAVLSALELFPNLKEIIADIGYTRFGKDFVRPLHRLGINIVMDYDEDQRRTMELVKVGHGDNKQILRLHCGTFFPEWLPERWWIAPESLTGKKLRAWYAERATKFRMTPIGKLKDGSIRFICPQCDGRVTTNAKTHSRRKATRRTHPSHHRRYRRGILLQGNSDHPRRTTRYLPTDPLRHPRMARAIHPAHANRKPQQHAQKHRWPQTRLVPSARCHRQQHGTSRPSSRSQPTPSQKTQIPAAPNRKQQRPTTAHRQRDHTAQHTPSSQRNRTPRAAPLAHTRPKTPDSNPLSA